MDYEKKLKDALKDGHTDYEVVRWIESNFPELAESEDEMIRKRIYNYVNTTLDDNESAEKEKWLNWLKKQAEQKATTVWHDVSEVPDEMQEILVEWESPDATWHNIAFYDAETKAFRYLKQPISNVTRLAYVSDILTQSATKISDKGWSEEDEEELGIAIKYLQQAGQWDSATWLKSLKERLSKR